MLGYSSHFSVRMEEAFTKCWTKGCVLFVVVGCHCHSLFFWDQMHPTLFKALWMHDANQKTWPIDRDDGYEEDLLVPEQPPSKKQRIHVYMYIYIYICVYLILCDTFCMQITLTSMASLFLDETWTNVGMFLCPMALLKLGGCCSL